MFRSLPDPTTNPTTMPPTRRYTVELARLGVLEIGLAESRRGPLGAPTVATFVAYAGTLLLFVALLAAVVPAWPVVTLLVVWSVAGHVVVLSARWRSWLLAAVSDWAEDRRAWLAHRSAVQLSEAVRSPYGGNLPLLWPTPAIARRAARRLLLRLLLVDGIFTAAAVGVGAMTAQPWAGTPLAFSAGVGLLVLYGFSDKLTAAAWRDYEAAAALGNAERCLRTWATA